MNDLANSRAIRALLAGIVWSGKPAVAVSVESPMAETPAAGEQHAFEVLEVYLSVEEALKLAFPKAERFTEETVRLSDESAARVAERAGHPLESPAQRVYTAWRGSEPAGYAMVAEEVGRFHLITFLVSVDAEERVERVEILVYRESRGGEVRHRRFLQQYAGKSARDPVRLNKDIINITGATLSVRAVNRGVRKVMAILEETVFRRPG